MTCIANLDPNSRLHQLLRDQIRCYVGLPTELEVLYSVTQDGAISYVPADIMTSDLSEATSIILTFHN